MLDENAYNLVGNPKGLTLIGYPPANVYVKCAWKCHNCGNTVIRSYRDVRHGSRFGHRCHNGISFQTHQYQALAEKLGIKWLGVTAPPNVRTLTKWEGKAGNVVMAAYRQIAYSGYKSVLQELGVLNEQ